MAGKKDRNTVPTGTAKASGTTARPGTVDVFSVGFDGVPTYLDTVTNKINLAFFSRAGDRALNPDKFSAKKDDKRPVAAKRAPPVTELKLGPGIDKLAGEIIIKWINENSTTQPKKFTLDPALFGDGAVSFEKLLKVHNAMSGFELEGDHIGPVVRQTIFTYIKNRDSPSSPTSADFKNCMEITNGDGGIVKEMMTEIMWRSVYKNLNSDIIDEIKQYCQEKGLYSQMVVFGDGAVADKMAARKQPEGKPVEHGW